MGTSCQSENGGLRNLIAFLHLSNVQKKEGFSNELCPKCRSALDENREPGSVCVSCNDADLPKATGN